MRWRKIVHQLIVYPIIYEGFYTSHAFRKDFWTINRSISVDSWLHMLWWGPFSEKNSGWSWWMDMPKSMGRTLWHDDWMKLRPRRVFCSLKGVDDSRGHFSIFQLFTSWRDTRFVKGVFRLVELFVLKKCLRLVQGGLLERFFWTNKWFCENLCHCQLTMLHADARSYRNTLKMAKRISPSTIRRVGMRFISPSIPVS